MWHRGQNQGRPYRDYGINDTRALGGGLRGVLDRNHMANAYERYPTYGAAEWARGGGWGGPAGASAYSGMRNQFAGLRYTPQYRGWGPGYGGPPRNGGFF
ncbi:hypothetical protein AC578_6568 [Pseudocercospora eumusae]|uniref:Uncharacterized protein n=1 Tax=Pseudocercospora eumusae TaxID=321146 RepID=A0A139HHT1_9PEZI|nr:hypothetical protein AC578_6568 [Pseudocercospora eumusae]